MDENTSKTPRRPKPDWSRRIMEARKALGLSQAAFGERCNSSQSAIADYESGRSEPSLETFSRMAGILGSSSQWLIFGLGQMFENNEVDFDIFPTYLATIRDDPVSEFIASQIEEELRKENIFVRDIELLLLMTVRVSKEFRRANPARAIDKLEGSDLDELSNLVWSERHSIRNGLRRLRMELIGGLQPLKIAFRG